MASVLGQSRTRPGIFVSVLIVTLLACAQTPTSKTNLNGAEYYELLTRAQRDAKDGKFAEAAPLFERLTHAYPDDTEVWTQFGKALLQTKQFRAAAEAYTQALSRGGEYPGFLTYRIATLYGRAGDRKQAFAWLEKSLRTPLEDRPMISTDDAFAAWREDEAFRKIAGLTPKRSFNREDGWNYDLDFLLSEIQRLHYLYRSGSLPAGFTDEVRSLRQRMPKLSDAAMEPEIQRLLARLGDGHTALQGALPRQIPFKFYEFSDGLFVIDAPQACQCVGHRLTALGSTPIETAVQKITPLLSVDNAMGVRLQAPIYLESMDYLRSAGIVTSDSEVVLSLEGPQGKHQFTAKPTDTPSFGRRLFASKLPSAGPVPRYLQHVGDNYWFENLGDGKTVYFQFNQVFDKPGMTLEQFSAKLHASLASTRIRNLIIDMRHNFGGNLNLFTPLLRTIIWFEASREGARLFIITSRHTFSAAQVFVNEVDRYTGAITAGEPTGSRPNFVGESAPTTLPYSGMQMTISTRYHQTDDQDQRTWISPKIPVALSSADYFANTDPVMDAVLAVAK